MKWREVGVSWRILWRSIFGVLSGIVCILAVERFARGFRYMEYSTLLSLWFMACLAGFHARYAFYWRLTETRARLIDYGYLGVAALGVVFFAHAYGGERQPAIRTLHEGFARITVGDQCKPRQPGDTIYPPIARQAAGRLHLPLRDGLAKRLRT
jgi:hypothetical protein